MIKHLTHVAFLVRDQYKAAEFYAKLGLKIVSDMPMDEMGTGARWVTLGIEGQPDLEIILQSPAWGPGGESAAEREALIGKIPGVIFEVDDCRAEYARLQAEGVRFLGEPVAYPWGVQVLFLDVDGNSHLLSSAPQN